MGGQIVMRCKVVGKSYGTRVTAVNAAEESRTFEGDYFLSTMPMQGFL
jgi:hypothetical protein